MKSFKKYVGVCLLFAVLVSNPVNASECSMVVNSNDAMQFDTTSMTAPSACTKLTVTLNHTGTLPANAMGHNWVLTKASDFQEIANAGMSAGLENNYVPVGDDRVIAASKIIGGGESTEVVVDLSGLSVDEEYTFFCSFPGHWSIMKGSFTLS